jgi:N-acetylmuramoyl-L-alanine amidase
MKAVNGIKTKKLLIMIFTIFIVVLSSFSSQNSFGAPANQASEIQLLARAINGEARGEPYEGQVAVGAVILNRVKSSSFPNSVAGVIYQPGAFTAVSDGQINVAIDSKSTVVKAAQDALNGWDPTYGCLYYWNPATATSKWIWSRKIVVKIGKHNFGK